jgi:hypothetical protein
LFWRLFILRGESKSSTHTPAGEYIKAREKEEEEFFYVMMFSPLSLSAAFKKVVTVQEEVQSMHSLYGLRARDKYIKLSFFCAAREYVGEKL